MFERFVNLLMPYDLYERHTVVRKLLGEVLSGDPHGTRVLDVGGRAELLGKFLPHQVASINVDGSGDLVGSGQALPFVSNAFAAVVSIDTLEHSPRDKRLPFLRECLRVARHAVVIAVPYGSDGHRESEMQLERQYRSTYGKPHVYLSEHVEYGLPDDGEVELWTRGLEKAGWRMAFAGDYVWQSRHFEGAVLEYHGRGMFARVWHLCNQVRSWALFHPVRLAAEPYSTANRLYLLLAKHV